jgi:hypothetical protein
MAPALQTTAQMPEQERVQPIIQAAAPVQVRLQIAPTPAQTQTEQIRIPIRTAQTQTLAVINNLHSELFSKDKCHHNDGICLFYALSFPYKFQHLPKRCLHLGIEAPAAEYFTCSVPEQNRI